MPIGHPVLLSLKLSAYISFNELAAINGSGDGPDGLVMLLPVPLLETF